MKNEMIETENVVRVAGYVYADDLLPSNNYDFCVYRGIPELNDAPICLVAIIPSEDYERLRDELAKLRHRLEVDRYFVYDHATESLVEKQAEPGEVKHDGISCRDETIKLLEQAVAEIKAQRDKARELVLWAYNNLNDLPLSDDFAKKFCERVDETIQSESKEV